MKTIKLFILSFAVTAISACSSINVRNAQELASAGSSLSVNIADSYRSRADNLEFYLEGEYLLSGLKKGYLAPTEKSVTKIDSLKQEILKRKELFANFAKVYNSFADLAVFDESDTIEDSLRSLTSAVNDYSTTTAGKSYFTESDEDLAALSGRLLFTSYHKYKLKEASRLIRLHLEAALKLLEKQSEKSAVIALEEEIDRNRLKVTLALWNMGMAIPYDIIAEHVANYGLQVNRKETMQQIDKATTGKMSSAVQNVIKFRHKRELRSRKDAYNASIEALRRLITAHREFENGERISLRSLQSLIETITRYTEIMKEKKNEKK